MGPQQADAREANPNRLAMTRVATYERVIRANLERVWENVLDWEHLPHLHDSSFDVIELIEAGEWGWRVYSNPDHTGTIELVIADETSYVSRSYANSAQLAEIWTVLEPLGETTRITVHFDMPNIPPDRADTIGERMLGLYQRLWDEDEAMMMERQRRLTESRSRDRSLEIPDTVRRFQLAGREYELIETDDGPEVVPTICPHLLGPLSTGDITEGIVVCPWHGYRFELATGRCIEPAHAACKLPPSPRIVERDGKRFATLDA